MSKKIKCYNCGKECEVKKCSCGAEDWTCENCRVGSGHMCEKILKETKMLVDREAEIAGLQQQLAEKDKEIELANQKITILERALLNSCTELQESGNGYVNLAGSILKPENAMEIEYEIALSDLGLIVPEEGLCEYRGCNYDFEKQLKDQRHQVCEEIREFIEQPENSIFYDVSLYIETEGLRKFLDQIERGE